MKKNLSRKEAVRVGKRFTLFVWNEDMNYIFKIIKSLEDLCVLIDGVTKTVKHEKKTRRWIPRSFVTANKEANSLLVQPVISSMVKGISGREGRRAGKEYIDKNFLVLLHTLNNIEITNYFKYKPRFNGVFLETIYLE